MGKALETSKASVWAVFLTAHAVLVGRIEERLASAGLPPFGWYDVLWALERAADHRLRMSELADKVVVSRSNLTRLVDRLEQAGLVTRERSEEDRRGAYAVLTAQGQTLRKQMWPVYQTAIRELFEAQLSDEEALLIGEALHRILNAARAKSEGDEPEEQAGRKQAARRR